MSILSSSTSKVLLVLVSLSILSVKNNAQKQGFSVELIPRNSPESPFYDPNETSYQRLINAYHRSISRARSLSLTSFASAASADVLPDHGEFLMKFTVGNPPFQILGLIDTGSDLTWIQSLPCNPCYKETAPIFNPRTSSTFKYVTCASRQCQRVAPRTCNPANQPCPYSIYYGGGSYTIGTVAVDTFTLKSTRGQAVALRGTVFGCGQNSSGYGVEVQGIIGLGWGPSSLATQTSGRFSHCFGLLEAPETAKINFGAKAVVSGHGTVSTPLFKKQGIDYYYLNLEAISAGRTRVEASRTSLKPTVDGNIVIDSGSVFTSLPRDYFNLVAAAVTKESAIQRIVVPNKEFELCFRTDNLRALPHITMHFSGADVTLGPRNIYLKVAPGVSCFAVAPIDIPGIPPIYGNVPQGNFLVGYDQISKKLSFKPTDCSKM